MSSRILQQDSDALLTQNNEFLINENFIAANSIVTGSPVVSSTGITQDHNIAPTNISTGASVVSTTSVTQDHSLSTVGVISGQVVISTAGLIQNHSLQANDLATASPVIPSVNATELENFTVASIVTGLPTIGQPSFTQVNNIGLSDVETSSPIVESASDPNAIIIAEIEEIQQMFGGWQRRTYEVPDGRLVQAEREIQSTFGDVVSIDKKAKSLIKFGKSADLSANGTSTVWTVGGHEVYVNDNLITHISSSSAADVYEVLLECHTVSGTGQDAKFSFLTQTVILQGQTKVALPTPVARVSQVFNNNGVELVGRVTVYEDVAITAGVPNDPTKIHIDIPAGLQGSFKAATTFSDEDYYVLTGGFGSVSLKQNAAADFYLEVREVGKVFVQRAAVSASSGGPWDIDLDPAVIIPRNADVRITVETDTNNAVVFGVFKGYLAKVTG
jgi:hypothetical protein